MTATPRTPRPLRPSLARLAGPAAALALAAAACDSGDDAAPVAYVIDFPSTAAAVAADSVKVYLFAPEGNDCATLIQARRAGSLLPATIGETRAIPPCDLLGGGGEVTVDVGDAVLLGVAQRAGEDFLIGCTSPRRLEAGARDLTLSLTPVSNIVAVPATACVALSDKCAGRCQ